MCLLGLFKDFRRKAEKPQKLLNSLPAQEQKTITLAIESIQLTPGTLLPGAHCFPSDGETVDNLIKVDFYKMGNFADRDDFMSKAYTYPLFFNLERPHTYKENKSPWQLAKEKRPDIPKEALMLAPVDLDALFKKKLASEKTCFFDYRGV